MIVGQIEEVRLDEPAHELYAADSYLGGRVMVFDMDTFQFNGAGAPMDTHCRRSPPMTQTELILPAGPCPREFRGHLR